MNSIQNCGITNYPAVNCRNVNFKARLAKPVCDSLHLQLLKEDFGKTSKGFLHRVAEQLKKIAPGVEITGISPSQYKKGVQVVRLQDRGLNIPINVPGETPMDALEYLINKNKGEGPNLVVYANRLFGI